MNTELATQAGQPGRAPKPTGGAASQTAGLSSQELGVLELLLLDQDIGEISESLGVPVQAVDMDRRHIYEFFGVDDRSGLEREVARLERADGDTASEPLRRDYLDGRRLGNRLGIGTAVVAVVACFGGCLIFGTSPWTAAEVAAGTGGVYGLAVWRLITKRMGWDRRRGGVRHRRSVDIPIRDRDGHAGWAAVVALPSDER
jgi:DNA-binding CsgD family transcriptional regulator